MNEKEQLEATSSLIKACKGIGATYHENKIVLADGNVLRIQEKETHWYFLPSHWPVAKTSEKEIQIRLLEIHIKILQDFS